MGIFFCRAASNLPVVSSLFFTTTANVFLLTADDSLAPIAFNSSLKPLFRNPVIIIDLSYNGFDTSLGPPSWATASLSLYSNLATLINSINLGIPFTKRSAVFCSTPRIDLTSAIFSCSGKADVNISGYIANIGSIRLSPNPLPNILVTAISVGKDALRILL